MGSLGVGGQFGASVGSLGRGQTARGVGGPLEASAVRSRRRRAARGVGGPLEASAGRSRRRRAARGVGGQLGTSAASSGRRRPVRGLPNGYWFLYSQAGNNAYDFGKNLVLAQHCGDDIESFLDKKQRIKNNNFVLITTLQGNPELNVFLKNNEDIWKSSVINQELKSRILAVRPGIITDVRKKCDIYIENCVKNVATFPHLETVRTIETVLRNISERLNSVL